MFKHNGVEIDDVLLEVDGQFPHPTDAVISVWVGDNTLLTKQERTLFILENYNYLKKLCAECNALWRAKQQGISCAAAFGATLH